MYFMDLWFNIFDEQRTDAYVDDTGVGVCDAHLEQVMGYCKLVTNLQHTAQVWERLLYSSSGVLNVKKCFWYLVHWEWHKGRPSMATSVISPVMIALTSRNIPVYKVVPRKEPWDAMRTLEV
jgi:hypothetical protein